MKKIIGRKVTRTIELLVESKVEVFGEVIKEKKFKTGNRSVTLKAEGVITDATENSVEVSMKRWTSNGVDCKHWFESSKFERTFIVE